MIFQAEQTINQKNISQENAIQKSKKDYHIENNPQVTQEIKESQSISQSQNHNESILEKPKNQNLDSEVSNKEKTQELFDEDIT